MQVTYIQRDSSGTTAATARSTAAEAEDTDDNDNNNDDVAVGEEGYTAAAGTPS
jgi:hypothetical protein